MTGTLGTEGGFLVLVKSKTEAEVVRLKKEKDLWIEESRHHVKGGSCDCEGFKYRKNCSHLSAFSDPIRGLTVPLSEARELLGSLVKTMGSDARLPEEPYERDQKGEIVGITLNVKSVQHGYYEGLIEGVKVRLNLV